MAGVTPYSYVASGSRAHSLGAGKKLFLLFVLSFAALSLGTEGLIASAVFVLAGAAFARLPPSRLLSGSSALIWTTAFVVLLRAVDVSRLTGSGVFAGGFRLDRLAGLVDQDGLAEGLLFAGGLLVSFAAGSLLFATTTMTELRHAVARLQRAATAPLIRLLDAPGWGPFGRISRSIEAVDLSLVVALTLGFMPRVFEVWESAADSRKARCGSTGMRGTAGLLPLVAERLMDLASETAEALEVRGYSWSLKR